MYTYNSVIEFKFIYLQFYRSKQNEYDVIRRVKLERV